MDALKKITGSSMFIIAAMVAMVLNGCQPKPVHRGPEPMGGEENEDRDARKKAYFELIHRAAPGTNWREVEANNALSALYLHQGHFAERSTAAFAGGAINGTWYERGNDNLAGRIDHFAFMPSTSTLYATADGGSIWKTALPTVAWTKVSDKIEFSPYAMCVTANTTGSTRVLAGTGLKVMYSDNNGTTFDSSTGISFPVAWGGNYIFRLFSVNDAAHTVYCITYGWEPSSWTAEFCLYASTDHGTSFHQVRYFPYHSDNQLSFATPVGSSTLYALGVTSGIDDTLYAVNSGVVSIAGSSSSINAADASVDMKCMVSGGTTHFYALTAGSHIYHSTSMGSSWSLKSTVSNAYIIGVSSQHPNDVEYGGVEAYRSNDSGATWTIVNTWGSYYGAMATDLHADLRNFSYFQYASGTEFGLVGTDGGAYITNDQLSTVSNISLLGLHVNQLWDHITSPVNSNIIVGGAQDQGLQSTNAGSGTGLINENQVISGDYGQLRITGGGNTLWPEYPGGNLYLYNSLSSPAYIVSWTMDGTQKSNAGWMMPTSNYFNSATQDEILIGGGNITGDSGSYIAHLVLTNSGGYTVTPTQYNYNFRTHSNSGTSGVSCIAVSTRSTSLMYAGTEDGTFFYSTDAGTSWNKTAGFTGVSGMWLYGAAILPSVDSVNTVYYGGSGYSNPAVYVSKDHGVTFTAMGTGLPPTLVNSMASYSNDSFLFAATDAGPYVYVRAASRWYSLADSTTPVVTWRSVEYLPGTKTIRFGTYGRGIWDFNFTRNHTFVPQTTPTALDVKVGPNPLKSGYPLTLFTDIQTTLHLNIYTTTGQQVYSNIVAPNSPIPLNPLTPGMYLYEIKGEQGSKNGMLVIN